MLTGEGPRDTDRSREMGLDREGMNPFSEGISPAANELPVPPSN